MKLLLPLSFIVLTLACIVLAARSIYQALHKTTLSKQKKQRFFLSLLTILGIWLAFISAVSFTGFVQDFSTFPPRMLILLVIPILLLILLLRNSTFKVVLSHIPPTHLLQAQSFRVVVEVLLFLLFVQNALPVQMTFEGLNYDIVAGILGPIAAFFAFRKGETNKKLVVLYNSIGLLLLLNIVIIALLSMPTPKQYFFNEPANTIVATFPYILLPGILVPFAYYLHVLSFRRLSLQ